MPYGVYLPTGYDDPANKDRQWPLIIWLHGMWEDHMRFHHRGGAPLLDEAVSDGKLPPCIFVTANGGRSSMYVNREDERWEDLISEDLLQAPRERELPRQQQARTARDHGCQHGRHGRAAHRIHEAGAVRRRRCTQLGGVRRGPRRTCRRA